MSLKDSVRICKCMLTNVSLKLNKFHENRFRNILNTLMPKIPKWSDRISKAYME